MYNSIVDAVIQNSIQNPTKTAVADPRSSYSYKELVDKVFQLERELRQKNICPGDSVLVECTQDTAFVALDLACELLGAIFVPLEKKATNERVKGIFSETKAKCILGESDYAFVGAYYNVNEFFKSAEKQPASVEKGSEKPLLPAEILFTTGTTGQPKGIIISHVANIAVAENICCGVEMKANTVELIPLPLSHSHGLRTCYANLVNGSTAVIMDGVMNVGLFFKLIEEYKVNAIDISPTLAKLLLKIAKKGLLKCADVIDYIEIGTAVLEDETKQQLKTIFPKARLYNFYGSTEAGRTCVLDFNSFDETGCIGFPAKNASFYIVDDKRSVIHSSKDNPGLIAVAGKMMMDGYLNSEELTKETLVNGILYTNDLGYVDENGRIYVIGRQDDIINYKGIKIAPEEIESVALRFDGISDCACVPIPDKVCGQVPKLFISVDPAYLYDEKRFIAYLKENLEASRIPAQIEVIDKIPRSSNGKLQRKRLRNDEAK